MSVASFDGDSLPNALATVAAGVFKTDYDVYVNGQLMEASGVQNDATAADVACGPWTVDASVATIQFSFPLVTGDKVCIIKYT